MYYIDDERKGPGAMQDETLLNRISALDKPNNETLIPRDQLDVLVIRIATVLLKAKLSFYQYLLFLLRHIKQTYRTIAEEENVIAR